MIPPFCPNRRCGHHHSPKEEMWYMRNGTYTTGASGEVKRFVCRTCGSGFSEQTFSLDYAVKRKISYQHIFMQLKASGGIRTIARDFGVTHKVILNRCFRLSRQAIALHSVLQAHLSLAENLAADGFESFVQSQYRPNNIHILVGSDSQFLYGIDYAHLKRKGRMTVVQKNRRAELEELFISGKRTITTSFSSIVEMIEHLVLSRNSESITLFTDEKPQYSTCLRKSSLLSSLAALQQFSHVQISSRKKRTVRNPLFPVNYMDREIRKDCANHVRETMQYSRSVSGCMARLAVYRMYHNYCKPYRIDDPAKRNICHAEAAGITAKAISDELRTFFTRRRFLSRVKLCWSDALIWLRGLADPGRLSAQYCPGYVWD